jgi:hypothetical protein
MPHPILSAIVTGVAVDLIKEVVKPKKQGKKRDRKGKGKNR